MNSKIIVIAGSTGFIAGELIKNLKEYNIIKLKRDDFFLDSEKLSEKIKDADVVINLAGFPIIKRWTDVNKRKIYDSRIKTTSKLVHAISLVGKEIHFINASAIGIYSEHDIHDEKSNSYSKGFIYEVIMDWEQEAMKLTRASDNVAIVRIGIVLASQSGLLKKIIPVFKAGFGGKISSGNQCMSFIHIEDLISSVKFIIQTRMVGIINLTTPYYVTNNELTRILSQLLKRPAIIHIPVFLLKLLYGEGASIILASHRILPEKLMNNGFIFKYPDIYSALKSLTVH